MKIEEEIQALLDEQHTCVVTAVPDDARANGSSRSTPTRRSTPQALWERLCQTELPRLWLPKREDLRFVEAIPTLGTGKVDLRAVRQAAMPAYVSRPRGLPRLNSNGRATTSGRRRAAALRPLVVDVAPP